MGGGSGWLSSCILVGGTLCVYTLNACCTSRGCIIIIPMGCTPALVASERPPVYTKPVGWSDVHVLYAIANTDSCMDWFAANTCDYSRRNMHYSIMYTLVAHVTVTCVRKRRLALFGFVLVVLLLLEGKRTSTTKGPMFTLISDLKSGLPYHSCLLAGISPCWDVSDPEIVLLLAVPYVSHSINVPVATK